MARTHSHCRDHRFCSQPEHLPRLLDRATRDQTGLFWAEGCRSVWSAINAGWPISTVAYCPKLLRGKAPWQALEILGNDPAISFLKLQCEQFAPVSRMPEPDGIGVVARQSWRPLIDEAIGEQSHWVALHAIRTPGNLGTIMRTCAATGAQGIMLLGGELDPHDPAVIRASMGAIFSTPIIRTSVKALAGWKARHGVHIIGSSPNAALDYRQPDYDSPTVLLMGSERSGLSQKEIAICDVLVRLPMNRDVDSLNLAIATGVLLYEIQRGRAPL